jgi:hypothetical protein
MAPKSKAKPAEEAAVSTLPTESVYPTIESFIETASADEVKALYDEVRASLGTLKGPRAEQGKKAGKGVARTEELLSFLLQVREKIEAERKGK